MHLRKNLSLDPEFLKNITHCARVEVVKVV